MSVRRSSPARQCSCREAAGRSAGVVWFAGPQPASGAGLEKLPGADGEFSNNGGGGSESGNAAYALSGK